MINYFKNRGAALVFFITLLIYSPILFNGYVGDDDHIIVHNTFYHSWQNIPRVFGKVSDIHGSIYKNGLRPDYETGKDEYRPISNFTYFFDYYLFQAKPYGSHLISILIHCINSVLVYKIVTKIIFSSSLAVFAGLLFSLHPIQSQAVAVMSYRADVLAAMFVLLSFNFWIDFRQTGYTNKKYYYGSLGMYFLALFSKETTFILPLVILFFDQIFGAKLSDLKQRKSCYIGFVLILLFFIYLYLFVFPPPLDHSFFHWLGGSFINHCLIMVDIWGHYLINIFLPWTVKVIPDQYRPPVPEVMGLLVGVSVAIILFIKNINVFCKDKECVFFLFWYIVFYLPVSNLIPIANPIESRYMYLPSIGLLIVYGYFLHKIFQSVFLKKFSQNFSHVLHGAVIMICVTRTLFLNIDWKNNFYMGSAWIRDYPKDYEGYVLLGKEYDNAGQFYKAKEYLERSALLGEPMFPTEVLPLALCYVRLGEFQSAIGVLNQIILHQPDYTQAFYVLGMIYYDQKNYKKAQEILEKALKLDPKEPLGYTLLMKIYLNSHKYDLARDLLKQAGFYLSAQNVADLNGLFKAI